MAEQPLSDTEMELHEEGRPLADPRPDLGERLLTGWPRDLIAAPYRLFVKPLLQRRRSNLIENPRMEAGAAGWTPKREEPEMAKSKKSKPERKPRLASRKSAKDGQHYVRVVSANNRTLASTEGFTRKETAERNEEALVEAFAAILRVRGWKVEPPPA